MTILDELITIIDRILAAGSATESELAELRQVLSKAEQTMQQSGKYIVNIQQGEDIHIGDRTYQGADAEAIREALRSVLQEKQKAQRPRNEKLLLQAVKEEVVSRLNQSLHNAVCINLAKEEQPDQVKCLWSSDIRIGSQPSKPIPDSQTILEVFDREEITGKLLVLGKPGAGKTTTMVDLAKALIGRAEQDVDCVIPVLCNLSGWKEDKQSMRDWLVLEVKSKYGIRKDIVAKWVDDAKLLPMLDGLDELESVRQELCVRRINEFLQSECHPQYLVVCSRKEEYEKVVRGQWQQNVQQESEENLFQQDKRLNLNNALVLKELTNEQIQMYLEYLNKIEIWNMLQLDSELLSLVRKPLFLSLIGFIATHKTLSIQEFQNRTSINAQHQYLFDAYWKAAIKRDIVTPQMYLQGWSSRAYEKKNNPNAHQTRKWLVYLANQLQRQHETEFLIEKIQPDWLPNKDNKKIYALGVGSLFGFIVGSIGATIVFIIISHFTNIFVGQIVGLSIGLFMAIFSGLWACFTIGQSKTIEPVETLNISLWSLAKSLMIGCLIGFISWIITLVTFPLLNWKPPDLVFFMVIAPILISILEMSGPQLKIRIEPNQGIKKSFYNAIYFASLGSIWLGLSAYLMREQIFVLIISLLFNKSATPTSAILSLPDTVVIVIAGMLAGTFFGLTESGTACIQHFILRLILCCNGYIPWNYARFLDYCKERIFLQSVGGRYRFIHILLQKHFAEMPLER
ncbi:hypothetical protein QUB68_24710 [Microcoleus sp. A006_D1]|uniref:hypothetical protein n=1 Tax=Microcoleus sp. A006_D1 TaxID=3055267 RepID=UPI002FD09399